MTFTPTPPWPRNATTVDEKARAPLKVYYVLIEGLGLREIVGEGVEDEVILRFLAQNNLSHIFFSNDVYLRECRETFTINKIA